MCCNLSPIRDRVMELDTQHLAKVEDRTWTRLPTTRIRDRQVSIFFEREIAHAWVHSKMKQDTFKATLFVLFISSQQLAIQPWDYKTIANSNSTMPYRGAIHRKQHRKDTINSTIPKLTSICLKPVTNHIDLEPKNFERNCSIAFRFTMLHYKSEVVQGNPNKHLVSPQPILVSGWAYNNPRDAVHKKGHEFTPINSRMAHRRGDIELIDTALQNLHMTNSIHIYKFHWKLSACHRLIRILPTVNKCALHIPSHVYALVVIMPPNPPNIWIDFSAKSLHLLSAISSNLRPMR